MPINLILYDPGLRCQIWDYDVNQQDEIQELTLKLVRTNVISQHTENWDKQITFVAFNFRGSCYFLHDLNIHLIKMQHFAFHAFSLESHLGILPNVYLQQMDLRIERELEMENIVRFSIIQEKVLIYFTDLLRVHMKT